jgi:hypothetical protein
MRRLLALLCAATLSLAIAPVALAAAPTNDEQTGATVVTVTSDVPFAITQDTTEATVNATDPVRMETSDEWVGGRPRAIGPTVWYVYAAAESGQLSFDLTGTDYGPMMLLLQGDGAVLDFSSSLITHDVLEGQTYYLVLGDEDESDGLGGMLSLTVSFVPPDPVPVDAQLAVTGASLVDGQLVVTGTVTASGDYVLSTLVVDAAQKGRDAATGTAYMTDPGTEWTVSVPASTTWHAARTTVTAQVRFYLDPDESAIASFTTVATVQVAAAAPSPTTELGSLIGRFWVTDRATGKVITFVVDIRATSADVIDYSVAAEGRLSIRTGEFAGSYATPSITLYTDPDGQPAALISTLLPDGQRMQTYFLTNPDGTQYLHIERYAAGGGDITGELNGDVTRKAFTITMPTP